MDKFKMESVNMTEKNIEKIAALFPSVVTEMEDENGRLKKGINFELLKQELFGDVIDGEECYDFTWVGKKASIVEGNKPIRKTLRPCIDESKDWENTENLYIEGDNLDVLKLLQESYLNSIKMIYIDPPYNTGNDFIYKDNFTMDKEDYDEQTGLYDEDENRLFQNNESNGRFHSDWCSMLYPRLQLARNLLANDGAVFISIDDNEVDNLKKICNEVFGESNFVDCITWNTRVPKNDNKGLGNIHQYVLVYVKQAQFNRQFMMTKDGLDEVFELLDKMKKQHVPIPEAEGELKKLYNKKGYDRGITLYNALDENYQPWGKINMSWPNSDTFGPTYDVLHPATRKPTKKPDRGWRWNQETFNSHLDYDHVIERHDGSFVCGGIWFAKDENTQPSSIKYLRDVGKMLLRTIISLKSDGGVELEDIFEGKSYFSNPKPTSLLKLLINSIEEKEGISLDFFSGSSTTAHAVMQLNSEDGGNRKFIMVQLPEPCDEKSEAYKAGYKNICEIGKERIRRTGEKIKSEVEESNKQLKLGEEPKKVPDIGFRVLKLDSTNMKDVYYGAAEYDQTMLDHLVSNVKDDRTDMDLLYGILLEWGLPLSLPHKMEQINGVTVHTVNEGDLIACFANKIDESIIREIAKRQPLRAVFRDSSFAGSPDKINVEEIFKLMAPKTTVKVI